MFTPHFIAVRSDGEFVVACFGNVQVKTPYEDALLISHWLYVRAREAKRFAGDRSYSWHVIGTLHDANKPDPGIITARRVSVVKQSSWEIKAIGSRVVVKFGSGWMELDYRDAFTLSRWFRMRAKEAKRRAGDVHRHWSELQNFYINQYGSN